MKIDFIEEPELEFCNGGRHVDIRHGMLIHKPFDHGSSSAPKEIKLGVIGTSETVNSLQLWIENCSRGIASRKTNQPNLFPNFPGFGENSNLPTSLNCDSQRSVALRNRDLESLLKEENKPKLIRSAVDLLVEELKFMDEKTSPDVLVCALPNSLLERISDDEDANLIGEDKKSNKPTRLQDINLDFHDLFKAKVMSLRKPTQIILPETYNLKRDKSTQSKRKSQTMQDEATRAWNFYTALYYKSLGTPWRLVRNSQDLATCYIGISFYKNLDRSKLLTSTAQIFNERGEGIILRGGQAELSKDDRQPYLPASDAAELLTNSLALYRREHRTLPARVVLHKTSRFVPAEFDGFQDALDKHGVDSAEFISFDKTSPTRLFRDGKYPPLRGTFMSLDESNHLLYTRGSVDFFSTYPGMYIPRPLRFRCELVEESPRILAEEILALTKMNWNNTQFDRGEPITIRAARQVGSILKYLSKDDQVEPHYRFYM
jgi:hypothetical protein